MKKLKLLLAACALLIGGVMSGYAQASYNHIYTEGVEVAAGSNYFLYNIGSGMFLTDGMDYGTHASVDHAGRIETLEANGNGFSIYSKPYSANGTAEKAGFLTLNGYVDTGTNDANWVFTPVSVNGYTNAYTIKNSDTQFLYYEVKDGLYNGKMGAFINVGNSTGDNASYWLLIPLTAVKAANDYTYLLRNTDFHHPWELPMWKNSTNWTNLAGGKKENACAEMYGKGFDIFQTISAKVSNGKYKLYNQAFYNDADKENPTYLYANDDKKTIAILNANGEGTVANMAGASTSFTAGQYVNEITTIVTNESLKVGIKNATTAGNAWTIMDNFYLEYLGSCLVNDAVALPANGTMVADTWYYFDVTTAAENYLATATTLNDIICTTDGTQLTASATGNVTLTAENNSFAAQRYYVKSSSANQLVVAAASYSYNIGEATTDFSYIQNGNTVTVSFTKNTNDPDAQLAHDYSGVTFGVAVQQDTKAVTPTADGFTFTVDNIQAGLEYVLTIPEGAIYYKDANNNALAKNAAQSITLKAPALLDGIYFLKVAATFDGTNEGTSTAVGKYLARGCNYSTHLSLDDYGLPIKVTTDRNNATTMQMADTNGFFFSTGNWNAYADGSENQKTSFTLSMPNGKYLIASNNRSTEAVTKYLKYNTSSLSNEEIAVYDDGTGKNSGPIIMWTVESINEHAAAMQVKKDKQAAAAAAAAYSSGNYASLNGITTVSALESELIQNYIEGSFVSPTSINSVKESYEPQNSSVDNAAPITVYSNTIKITEAGFYKFSMQAFNRATFNKEVQALHTLGADMPAAMLFFGDSETQIKSLYDEDGHDTAVEGANPADVNYNGKYYANCMTSALKMFKDNKYHNNVWFYASAPGTYTYGVKVMGHANGQWFIYSPESVTITSYAPAATADDYAALNTALATAENITLGFDEGEYAPYKVGDFNTVIATAKALNQETQNSQLLVRSLTTSLNSFLSNSVNTTEENAFYDGDFSEAAEDTTTPVDVAPKGWTNSTNNENMRLILKNSEAYPGLTDASANSALMSWSGGITYGNEAGYEMPLNAHTIYELTFKAASWNNEAKGDMTVSVLNSTDGMAATNLGMMDKDIMGKEDNPSGMTEFKVLFATGAAGNYVFSISSTNNFVLTDLDLRKATNQYLEFADNAPVPTYAPGTYPSVKISRSLTAGRWATAVYPFAVSGVDEIAVIDEFNSQTGELSFKSANTSEANKPFLMRSNTGKNEIMLTNVNVEAIAESPVAATSSTNTSSDVELQGVYSTTNITAAEKNYVLSNNKIYEVGEAGATIAPYRAYFHMVNHNGNASARLLSFSVNGEATAIEGVSAEKGTADSEVYNLHGQKMNGQLKKGIYIIGGKRVVVK